jgi:hypothetical protein
MGDLSGVGNLVDAITAFGVTIEFGRTHDELGRVTEFYYVETVNTRLDTTACYVDVARADLEATLTAILAELNEEA